MFPRRRHQPGPLPECAKIPFLLADNGGDRRTGISPSRRTHHQARAHHQPWFNLLISKSAFANLMQKAQHLLLKRLRGSSKANIWEKVLSCHTSIHQESYPSLNSWESFGENACSASSSACLFGAFHTWCATQSEMSFLLSLLTHVVKSFISAKGIILLLGLLWFSSLSKSWGINSIDHSQQHTNMVLLIHTHSLLSRAHSQAKFQVYTHTHFAQNAAVHLWFEFTLVLRWRSLLWITFQGDEYPSASPGKCLGFTTAFRWKV